MDADEAREVMRAMVDEGTATSMDDAAHQLADMGEIDSSTHAEVLSKEESERCYG